MKLGITAPVFNARTQGAEKEGILNSMPVWAMQLDSLSQMREAALVNKAHSYVESKRLEIWLSS